MSLYFRHAVLEDAASCAEIYRPYVEKTSITFEYIPPEEAEIARRMECYTPALSHLSKSSVSKNPPISIYRTTPNTDN